MIQISMQRVFQAEIVLQSNKKEKSYSAEIIIEENMQKSKRFGNIEFS